MTTATGDAAWTAGVLLFSGRPDPTWTLDGEAVRRLRALWGRLPVLDRAPAAPRAALGYRGCFVQEPGRRRWTAFEGVVLMEFGAAGQVTHVARRDQPREFERTVLATAPSGVVPDGSIPDALR